MPSSHYIPPDFDPSKTTKRIKPKNGQHALRFMLPMAVQCENCGEYMHAGTKLNCRKEVCYNERYLNCINVYRIYFHCKACYAEIVIKTDPKNLDYIIEKGGTRHFEPWRNFLVQQAQEEKDKMQGSLFMQAELKTVDMKRDMDNMNELERLRRINTTMEGVKLESLPETYEEHKQLLTELDRQKIEMFEMRKMEELNIKPESEVFKNRIETEKTELGNPFKKEATQKRNFFASTGDDDEF